MIEQAINIVAAAVIFAAALLRLNILHAAKADFWRTVEVVGLTTLMAGCAGTVGEWFLPNEDFRAETVVLVGAAIFAVGVTHAKLCELVARLQGWDGRSDRRSAPRP